MRYKKEENEQGEYIDSMGVRYSVNECNEAHTPEGLNVGYTEFDSREAMMKKWKLAEFVEIEKTDDLA